ncbi:hypothetical protein FXW78_42740 [Rhodococcus opacus]|nr:hypothetical protein [Rhodococcus opacus]
MTDRTAMAATPTDYDAPLTHARTTAAFEVTALTPLLQEESTPRRRTYLSRLRELTHTTLVQLDTMAPHESSAAHRHALWRRLPGKTLPASLSRMRGN